MLDKVLSIAYEDLFPEETDQPAKGELDKISDFLGINTSLTRETGLTKTRGQSLGDSIENFSEVQDVLKDTPFEKYLESAKA